MSRRRICGLMIMSRGRRFDLVKREHGDARDTESGGREHERRAEDCADAYLVVGGAAG